LYDATGQLAFLDTSLIGAERSNNIPSLLYICLDFKNAFPTVSRDATLAALRAAGFPSQIIDFIADACDKEVKHLHGSDEVLPSKLGLAQGDVISSPLFAHMLTLFFVLV
jgi:hypothetical protein